MRTRKKVTDALVHGKLIEISGCTRRIQGGCPKREMTLSPEEMEEICPRRCTIQIAPPGEDEQAVIRTLPGVHLKPEDAKDTAQ